MGCSQGKMVDSACGGCPSGCFCVSEGSGDTPSCFNRPSCKCETRDALIATVVIFSTCLALFIVIAVRLKLSARNCCVASAAADDDGSGSGASDPAAEAGMWNCWGKTSVLRAQCLWLWNLCILQAGALATLIAAAAVHGSIADVTTSCGSVCDRVTSTVITGAVCLFAVIVVLTCSAYVMACSCCCPERDSIAGAHAAAANGQPAPLGIMSQPMSQP